MDEIEKLKEYNEKLSNLLNNPELDLESWYMAVSYACNMIGRNQHIINQIRINSFKD